MKIKTRTIIIAVILAAVILRLWALSNDDMLTDEVYYSLRSIGFLDYAGMEKQSTPLDWFVPLPGWTHLSFHDHPPLVFIIQHLFFLLFGVSIFVSRLPFALAGVISVYLIYLIAKKTFDEKTALLASALAAIMAVSVYISRVALMESIVITLILLAWYLFSKALEKENYWYWWGAAVGLSFLAKYTAFPILVVFLIYLLIYKREVFKNYRFYLGLLLVLVIFSPVIIYNFLLFQNTGHFDLQFAALFGQKVEVWQTLTAKVSGSFFDKFFAIGPALLDDFSPVTITLLILAVIFSFFSWLKKKAPANFLLLLFLVSYLLLFILINPLPRFVTTIYPFVIILIAQFVMAGYQTASKNKKIILTSAVVIFFVYEGFFSINTNLTTLSFGWPNLTFSLLRPYSADFGVNRLDNYLNEELKDVRSAVIPQSGNNNLDEFIKNRAKAGSAKKSSAYVLLVYNPLLYEVSTLWLFDRRFIYDSIPTAYVDNFVKLMDEKGPDVFKNYNIYYITGTENALWRRTYKIKTEASVFEEKLVKQGIEPEIIYSKLNIPMFKVYKFSL